MLELKRARHAWPEKAGFRINRHHGSETDDYVFLLFHTPMNIELHGEGLRTKPGALIVYDKTTPQYFGSEADVIHDWMHLDGEVPEIMAECGLEFNTVYYPPSTGFITDTVGILENEHFSAKRHSENLSDALIKGLFYRLSRAILDGERAGEGENETSKRIRDMRTNMFANLEKHHSVSGMASSVNLSESRFFALYKQLFGISPTKDLIAARVERAKSYLSGGYSVNETAELVGYTNVFHFIRQFKDVAGMTPGEFKN